MSDLTPEQLKAAEFKDGICAVIAVPGSGKTKTMMERIGILVNKHGIAPENILGLTFTKNAAAEMKSRLVEVLGDRSERVHLSTIHSFCYYLLKREGFVFEIVSGKEQLILMKEVMKQLKIKDLTVGTVLREISLAKNNLIFVDEFKELFVGDPSMMKVAVIYERYDDLKFKKMLLDFDDLLIQSYVLLRDHEKIRGKYLETFSSVLIDEFQDTNPVQLEILKLLITENSADSSFWVCGDDHQSIYGFAGASVGNILNFKTMFPLSEQFILELNFRSTQKIVQACSNLANHFKRQIHKEFKTNNIKGDDVIVLESSNEMTEALALVREITDLVERKGYKYNEIAVLYRANFQSLYPEEAFLQNKIPFYIQGGSCFYKKREIKFLLFYLRVIQDPDCDEADEALLNILNAPVRYISNKSKAELKEFCDKKDIHLYQGLKETRFDTPFIRKNIREFINFMDPLIDAVDTFGPSELLKLLRNNLDYDRFIVDEDLPTIDDVIIENLNHLQLSAARYNDIKSFLEYTDTFEDSNISENKDGVSLMTIHKSKGLEFKIVFLIGLVDTLLPSAKGNIEEERRICFVAISRAMELLFLSYPLGYLNQPSKKSIFIDEILGNKEPAVE
ncbi:MAG: ATP-dependent helicase [Desulfobacula sp.]|jgi:DNA helicase II / ATP-dependent DNA helicase PcrA|nr:ATP-dependent helicase [Desulfobacula sp.]